VAYERAIARWGIAVEGDQLSFGEVFDATGAQRVDVVLDIGFGGGEGLIELAETRPHEAVIGVDVHTPGIAAVLDAVESRGLRNVRVVDGDVIEFLPRIPARSLDTIRVFFPDPWPKQRQRTRRLIRADVVRRLSTLMRVGGTLHLATDDADYATQMQRVCETDAALTGGVIARPHWRPVTRFEQRGIDEGRRPVDLVYSLLDSSPRDSSSALR
jgi:tRNA (guanine-N7-)-methyltransferase